VTPPAELRTERLLLRQWRAEDREPWASLNADPEVMRHFPSTLSRAEADDAADRCETGLAARGWGLWAVEVLPGDDREAVPFVGFTGLNVPGWDAHFTPCVEVGWRLARAHWGHGYATEGARAAVAHGFDVLALDEIVSFTYVGNERSRRVMERLGMVDDGEFDHPTMSGSPIERHVLYRLRRRDWTCPPGSRPGRGR
jgi:RimJ/RimL family protein N-acetyltransferase